MDKAYYRAANAKVWEGRIDSITDYEAFRIHQVVTCIDLNDFPKEGLNLKEKNICLLGFACDEGVKRNKGRIGASQGPKFIRKALSSLPVHFSDSVALFDAGDILCENENLEEAQKNLSNAIEQILSLGMHPIIMGGGHEIAFGSYHGAFNYLQKQKPKNKLGILNFDAHFDMRPYDEISSSGTMFLQIADQLKTQDIPFNYFCIGIQPLGNTKQLFNTADAHGVHYLFANQLSLTQQQENLLQLKRYIDSLDDLYITICSDVFHLSAAPGVSAPAPLGIMPKEMLPYLHLANRSGKSICMDIAEVNPSLDIDNHTSKLAASLIYEYILHHIGV